MAAEEVPRSRTPAGPGRRWRGAWILGDTAEPLGLVTVVGKPYTELRWTGVKYRDIDRGCYEPRRRLDLLDADGIDAALIHVPQRTMGYFMTTGDPEFQRAGIETFNNWLIQEFCAVAPIRLGPIAKIPNAGVDARKLFGLATTMSFMSRLIAEMIFAGVFDRFPGLRMVANEVGAGWVPALLQDLDDRYWRNRG